MQSDTWTKHFLEEAKKFEIGEEAVAEILAVALHEFHVQHVLQISQHRGERCL
jgi:hypothetical protein